MVITANIILDKLNMISSQLCGVVCHPEPGQAEPVREQEELVQGLHVASLNFGDCWTSPSVKRKGIVFTMDL